MIQPATLSFIQRILAEDGVCADCSDSFPVLWSCSALLGEKLLFHAGFLGWFLNDIFRQRQAGICG